MIKAMARGPGGNLFVIGLSYGNLDKFRAEPRDTFIKIDGKEHGLNADIVIFSCETEAHGHQMMAEFIGPETNLHISKRLKS